MKFQLKMQ